MIAQCSVLILTIGQTRQSQGSVLLGETQGL